MSHKKFDQVKAELMDKGISPESAAVLAAMQTGETDGTVRLDAQVDTSSWTEDDWYQNNIKIGMSEDEARFVAAIESGSLNIDDEEVDY